MSGPSEFVVLVEDERQSRFIRRLVQRLHDRPQFRFVPLPAQGGGEAWVRKRYADEVRAYRLRTARAMTVLIVAIDADTNPVSFRQDQLRDAAAEARIPARTADEAIAHFIPKRNIETWILCLNNRQVNELTDYKREKDIDELIKPAALSLFSWSRPGAILPATCVPSLSAAIPEVKRL